MRSQGSAALAARCLSKALRYLAGGVIACGLLAASPLVARADDDGPKPAPRTSVIIGNASVVLIAANDKLYAFVDKVDDNSPVEDAELEIDTSEGSTITMNKAPVAMNKATAGLFVGPLNRKGHMQDAFLVTLKSSAGEGQEPAEIIYDDVIPPTMIMPISGLGSKVAVAVVSGSIGALVSVLFMLWLRGSRRRVPGSSAGSAQTV